MNIRVALLISGLSAGSLLLISACSSSDDVLPPLPGAGSGGTAGGAGHGGASSGGTGGGSASGSGGSAPASGDAGDGAGPAGAAG